MQTQTKIYKLTTLAAELFFIHLISLPLENILNLTVFKALPLLICQIIDTFIFMGVAAVYAHLRVNGFSIFKSMLITSGFVFSIIGVLI